MPADDHPSLYAPSSICLYPEVTCGPTSVAWARSPRVREILDEESTTLGGIASPWYFPPAEVVEQQLLATGFVIADGFVRRITQRRSVPDKAALIGWLDSQVLNAYRPSLDDAGYDEFRRRSIERSDPTRPTRRTTPSIRTTSASICSSNDRSARALQLEHYPRPACVDRTAVAAQESHKRQASVLSKTNRKARRRGNGRDDRYSCSKCLLHDLKGDSSRDHERHLRQRRRPWSIAQPRTLSTAL